MNDPYLRYQYDGEPLMDVYNSKNINLSVGIPGPDLLRLCGDMMLTAMKHRLKEEIRENKYYLFQYGINPGLWEYRNELSQFLSRRYGDAVKRENLILTCGATSGLQLIINSIISPDGVIFVEELTYMLALDIFKHFPLMKIIPVPFKRDCIDLDAFEQLLQKEKKRRFTINKEKIFWSMFYTIPTFHNPTGNTLKPEFCQRLVQIARKHSFLIVCDDVYNLLHYEAEFPPHRLFFYDDPEDEGYKGGNVISNGSFSKILFPSIRVGWMECSPRITENLKNSGILNGSGAVNHFISGTIASLLHLKLEDEFLDVLIETYKERLLKVCKILDEFLPQSCSYKKPKGGYFLWIELPPDMDASIFIDWCKEVHNVSAIPGIRFSCTEKYKNFFRLSIAFHSSEILKDAVKSLCLGLKYYIVNIDEIF